MSVNGWRSGGGGSTAGLASLTGATFSGDVLTSRLGAGSADRFGTAEKFRVNTPVTASNAVSAMIATSATNVVPLMVQGAAGHATNFFEVQNSGGTALFYINSTGIGVFGGAIIAGGTAAAAGQVRLPNNTAVNWRNAANSADLGITVDVSGIFQVGGPLTTNGAITANASGAVSTNGAIVGGTGRFGSGTLATAGTVRLDNNATINWRNAGNTANIGISVNASDQLALTDALHITVGTTTGTQIATATNQKLGFWAKTPVVQPTTAVAAATRVAGAGTSVLVDDTYDGYTVAKVVAALRTIGILA